MRAPEPPRQQDRLEELESYGILDTPPEAAFDETVALVREICDVPVALISFVDRDRQWFKAALGLPLPETPVDRSICAHAILCDEVLEIRDTLTDPRTLDNPLCTGAEDSFRFYAGAPLITESGFALGSLCVLDRVPRALTDHQRTALALLSRQVVRQLELRRSLRNEQVLRGEIDHRVKNSLQTVASFIRLYSARATRDETREALSAIGRRVDAITQLHAELYQTSHFDMIRLDRYLGRVVDLLKPTLAPNVGVDISVPAVQVDSRMAATLAIIVAEFAANSNKHAFPDGRAGRIAIRIEPTAEGGLALECRDDGVGDTAPLVPAASGMASIGKKLMESAAAQIEAELDLAAGPDGYRLRVVTGPRPAREPPRADALSAG